ncbi:MAG: hypothetical protein ACW981_16140 [Candidatus Hodarchaeales archaeon]|jgi:hypothetical protein
METQEIEEQKTKLDSEFKKLTKQINQVIIRKRKKLYSKEETGYNIYVKRIFERFENIKKDAYYKRSLTPQEMLLSFLDLINASILLREEVNNYFNSK